MDVRTAHMTLRATRSGRSRARSQYRQGIASSGSRSASAAVAHRSRSSVTASRIASAMRVTGFSAEPRAAYTFAALSSGVMLAEQISSPMSGSAPDDALKTEKDKPRRFNNLAALFQQEAAVRERGRRDADPLKVLASLGYLGGSRRDIVLDRPPIDDRVGNRLEAAHKSREPPRLRPTCERRREECMSRPRAGIKTRRGMVPGR
jgi:hypothetical protein